MEALIRPGICALSCLFLGSASGFSTFGAIQGWYANLNKPVFNPPNWVFGPTWTVLYILMGIAAGLIWNLSWEKKEVRIALAFFGTQFLFNLMWSPVFFLQKQILGGLIIQILLIVALIFTMFHFFRLRKVTGWLLVPYLLWIGFALLLNFSLWRLNPGA